MTRSTKAVTGATLIGLATVVAMIVVLGQESRAHPAPVHSVPSKEAGPR